MVLMMRKRAVADCTAQKYRFASRYGIHITGMLECSIGVDTLRKYSPELNDDMSMISDRVCPRSA
jgi:hypothetical protein